MFCFITLLLRQICIDQNAASEALQAERDIDDLFRQKTSTGVAAANLENEVNESKQMLFKKYLGDQRQIQKFNEMKSMMKCRRDMSDDAISSNYPNSSFSTMRDLTSSSIGSINANSPSIPLNDDDGVIDFGPHVESLRKWENDESNNMRQFERLWKKDEEPARDLLTQHKLMENFLFPSHKMRFDSENSGNISESEQSFGFQKSGNISDSSPSTVISYSHKRNRDAKPSIDEVDQLSKSTEYNSLSSSMNSGIYSREYLSLANRFGSVIKTMRKPGHHVGPVKNPTCLCETCKRFTLERDNLGQPRERAFSFGDTPITKTSFWRRNNRHFV